VKFRLIIESDEITVITENGGVACIREAADLSKDEPRIAVTDYYQSRLTDDESINADNVFECLAEGKMYCNDWAVVPFNSMTAVEDALAWLCPDITEWEITNDLFTHLFDGEQAQEAHTPIIGHVVYDPKSVEIDNDLSDEEKVNFRLIYSEEEINDLYEWLGEYISQFEQSN
jgi:hypothetical protein